MNININRKSGVPIYKQIESQIIEYIYSGTLKEGEQLTASRSLAYDLKISVITVERVYKELEKEGIIYSVSEKYFIRKNKNCRSNKWQSQN